MDIQEQIVKFKDFFESRRDIISYYTSKSRQWIKLKFSDISKFDPDLANLLLDNPEDLLHIAEQVLESLDIKMSVRVLELPKTQRRTMWQFRGEDVGKFISLSGAISKMSNIIHISKSAVFECPSCYNKISVMMHDSQFKTPSKCACGFKGKFKMINNNLEDTIKLGICDDLMDSDNIDRNISREKMCVMSKDLVCKEIDRELKPGRKVLINGWFKYFQVKDSTEFESIFIVNSIEFVKVGWDNVKINSKEEVKIKELSKDPSIIDRMANSIADIEGFPEIKKSCLLLLAGSPALYDENRHLNLRSTIHILLIGDPGSAKTSLARRAGSISPINAFQSAQNASGKGLVAAVAQDKDLGSWVVYPGVVALAHKGVAVIDEIDKTAKEDYGDHNNAMNDMEVHIAKANVKALLNTETSYLATANPAGRQFSSDQDLSPINQIDMPKDFLDRFDYIFPVMIPHEEEKKEKIMDIMLDRHLNKEESRNWNPEFTHEFIQKYISYCRVNMPHPRLEKQLFTMIKLKLKELMKPKSDSEARLSFRHLESILRFAYASARLRLRDITEEDLLLAFSLKKKSFEDLGIIDKTTGIYDWSKTENIDTRKIQDKKKLKDLFDDMLLPGDSILISDMILEAEKAGININEVYEYIDKGKRDGNWFEPKPNISLRRL